MTWPHGSEFWSAVRKTGPGVQTQHYAMPIDAMIIDAARTCHDLMDRSLRENSHSWGSALRRLGPRLLDKLRGRVARLCKAADVVRRVSAFSLEKTVLDLQTELVPPRFGGIGDA